MKYSIIIPVFNDPVLPACLQSLAALTGDLEHEVIIVENSRTDWVRPLVEHYGFKHIFEPITGSYQARNAGVRAATGDVLVFTDSDCEVTPNWLQRIATTLENPAIAGVMGFSAGAPSNRVAALEQLMYEANIAQFTSQPALQRVDTRNLAIRRNVIERVGTFMEQLQFGGDMEFGARVHVAGFTIVYDDQMLVVHHNIKTAQGLLHKRVKQNYGNMIITQLHDREFIQAYFPHLLRYRSGLSNTLRYRVYRLLLWPHYRLANILLRLLPIKLGYQYFKAINVLAIRVGQLAFILGDTV